MTTSAADASRIRVSGGAGGTAARYADLAAMGRLTDDVAGTALGIAVSGHELLLDEDVLASALLDPAGVAAFERALLDALDGPDGLTAVAASIGLRGTALCRSAEAYRLADELGARLVDAARWLAGVTVVAGAATPIGLAAVAVEVHTRDGGDWQRFLVEHPGLAGDVVDGLAGPVPALTLPALTRELAAAYPHNVPVVETRGEDPHPAARMPPRGLGDIVGGLARRDADVESNVDVRRIVHPDGSVAYIVDIPGTRVWNLPGRGGDSANDVGTNLDAMAGEPSVLEAGVEQAMREAGIPPGAPVMLVGHSQGGMVAARAAHDFVSRHTYNVTALVTAGSPVHRMPVPHGVQMLALENEDDVVPRLDGADAPDEPNRTTVTFVNRTGTVGGNHALASAGNYAAVAAQLDTSADPSVRHFRNGIAVFTQGAAVETHRYQVTRGPRSAP